MVVVWVGGLALRSGAENPAPQNQPLILPLTGVEVPPALRTAALRDHIPLIQSPGGENRPNGGDSLVFWIGAVSGKQSRHWLLRISRAAISPEEEKRHQQKNITKYLSWGTVVTFQSDVAALDLWIAGPVDLSDRSPGPAAVKTTRVYVPKDYLSLGLDETNRVAVQISKRTREIIAVDPSFNLGNIYVLDEPIKPVNIGYAKPVAEKLGLNDETARSWSGGFVAMQAFYELANGVPELKEIAETVCERPSVWKIAKLAFGSKFQTYFGAMEENVVDPTKLGIIPVPAVCYEAPFTFSLEQAPIMNGSMLVTKPAPPLDLSAGIVALLAVHPKDRARVVEIRAISSQLAVARSPTSNPPSKP